MSGHFKTPSTTSKSDFNGLFVEKQPHSRYTLHLLQRAKIQEKLIFISKHRVHRINQKLLCLIEAAALHLYHLSSFSMKKY